MTIGEYWERLGAMRSLEKNWDSYGADPPSGLAVRNAAALCEAAVQCGVEPRAVLPSAMGGIGVSFAGSVPGAEVWCELYNRGTAHALFHDGSGDFDSATTRPVNPADFVEFVAWVRRRLRGDQL